jgi:antirestriction protein ArdC
MKNVKERDLTAESIWDGYLSLKDAPKWREIKSNRAYYSSEEDEIVTPLIEQFENVEEYYSTKFHEGIHSTGHKKRLARKEVGSSSFGSNPYAKEELVAEIGAAMLCEEAGLDTTKCFKNSASYVANWLQTLKNDKKLIVSAAGRAEKAVKYILGEN